MRIAYSRAAIGDLIRLRQFIAEKDPLAAARVAANLISRIERLGVFPRMGVAVAQAPSPADIRDMTFGNYVVRHSVHPDALVILRLWHHYEDRPPTR